jgi:ADP-heptose:LPS heptosyltransferase
MTDSQKVDNVKKIAVLRASALGDFIVTLPALLALRHLYPEAEIVLLGKQWHQQFVVKGRTAVDRVEIVPVIKGIHSENGYDEDVNEQYLFCRRMQQEEFDLAIGFHGSGVSANPFLKRLGARITVGTHCSNADSLDRSVEYYYYQHEVMRYLEVVSLVGATTNVFEPRLNVLAEDRAQANELLSYLKDKRYVLINPVANDTRRMWPLENYVRLADALQTENVEVVFTGSTADRSKVEMIINNMTNPAFNACGTSLGGLAAITANASLMISPDTGPLHLAQAVQCPTVGIYWAPNIINWGPLNRNIHRPVISWKMECPYCEIVPNNPYPFQPSTTCKHEVSFVKDITIEEVLQSAKNLLAIKDSVTRRVLKKMC